MERQQNQHSQEAPWKSMYDADGVLIAYREYIDENGESMVESHPIHEVPETVSPSKSRFKLSFEVDGHLHDIPEVMRHFSGQAASQLPVYEPAPAYAPSLPIQPSWNPEPEDAPAAYDRADFYQHDENQAAVYDNWNNEPTQTMAISEREQPQQISWNDPEEQVQPRRKERSAERTGKPRARVLAVLSTIVLVGAGVGIDAHHAVKEAPENAAACADKAGLFAKLTTLPCVGEKFFLDMAMPLKNHNAADTAAKKESK